MLVQKVADFWSIVREFVESLMAQNPHGIDGIVVPGSYKASDGTATIFITKTASDTFSPTRQPLMMHNVPIHTTGCGDQAGPIGGENVVLTRSEGGWSALPHHISTNSPGAPSGERWILPPSYKNPTPNTSSLKLTNSGSVDIVGMNSATVTAPTITSTASGNETHTAHNFSVSASNDVAITATSAASLIAPSTEIGPSGGPYLAIGGGGAGGDNSVIRRFEFNALVAAFNAHVHSGVQGGTGNTAAPTTTASTASGSTNVTAG